MNTSMEFVDNRRITGGSVGSCAIFSGVLGNCGCEIGTDGRTGSPDDDGR